MRHLQRVPMALGRRGPLAAVPVCSMGTVAMSRPSLRRPRHSRESLALREGDVLLDARQLASRLGVSTRTIARAECPFLALPQREGASGVRLRRRYILRVALTHFSAHVYDPRSSTTPRSEAA